MSLRFRALRVSRRRAGWPRSAVSSGLTRGLPPAARTRASHRPPLRGTWRSLPGVGADRQVWNPRRRLRAAAGRVAALGQVGGHGRGRRASYGARPRVRSPSARDAERGGGWQAGRMSSASARAPAGARRRRTSACAEPVVIAVSQSTAVSGANPSRSAQTLRVVHNGVDLARFAPGRAAPPRRSSCSRAPDRPVPRDLCRPYHPTRRGLRARDGQAVDPGHHHLAVAGDPNPGSFRGDAEAARSYADDLRARFKDVRSRGGPAGGRSALIARSDAGLPSRFDEPFGLAVLETLASGIPIVASAAGGIPEIMSGELAANLVASGEPSEYAQPVRSRHRHRRSRPRAAGRAQVASNFTLRRMGDELNDALDRVMQGRSDD